MAFIAIDAKADVADSKKGKLTPAQHAQLNAWCLASKTGILDWGNRCESSAASYSVSGGAATVYFRKGFAVVCGRLVECEEGSSVVVAAPSVGTVNGKIILRFNLGNSGTEEFEATTKTGSLVQQDLNDNATTGVYEFELYSYTATPTTVTLSRANTDYIPDIGGKLAQFITVLTGTGMTGTGNPPLQGYDESKGTIEERLTSLGFKTGSITLPNGSATVRKVDRQGNYCILTLKVNYDRSTMNGIEKTSGSGLDADWVFSIPENLRPRQNVSFRTSGYVAGRGTMGSTIHISLPLNCLINTSGVMTLSLRDALSYLSGSSIQNINYLQTIELYIGYEAPAIV